MAQKESQSERTEKSPLPHIVHPEFAAVGKKRMEEFVKAQKELLDKLQETNRQWFERMQSEVNVVSDFASKLTTVRSISDAATVCQDWMTRWFEMMTEDSQRLLADAQKFTWRPARACWQTVVGPAGLAPARKPAGARSPARSFGLQRCRRDRARSDQMSDRRALDLC
jgi:hypothetical protein